jgi:hypothetical protein
MNEFTHFEDRIDWFRASGNCECLICGKSYYDHPFYRLTVGGWRQLSNGMVIQYGFWLHVLCNGDLVKL